MPGIFGFRAFFAYESNLEHLVVAGEVDGHSETVLVQIDGPDKIADDHVLEVRIVVIAMAHRLHVGDHPVPIHIDDVGLLDGDQAGQAVLVLLEHLHALFDFISHHAHLNRVDNIVDLLLGALELFFVCGEFGFRVVLFRKLHQIVHDPVNRVIVQHGLQNSASDFLLNHILFDVRLFAGALRPAGLAGIVKILGAEVSGPGVAHHCAAAIATEQLAGEHIIVVIVLSGPDEFVILQLFPCHFKGAPLYDLRHAVLDANIVINICPGVSFILQNRME